MKIKTAVLATIFAFSGLFAGCADTGGMSADKTVLESELSSEQNEINIILDWYPNAIHAFLYDAAAKGYFEEEGLNINIITPAETIEAINFTALGKADIGFTYQVEIIQAAEKGMPVKALASVCSQQLDCLVSLKRNTSVTSDMASLRGKTIGYSGSALSEATIKTIAANSGLNDNDYELLNVGFDLVTSLITENVDIVVGAFINDEIVTMELAGYELNTYFEQDYGFPEMYGLVMAVNTEAYDSDPEKYQRFLSACKKGFEDIKADEEAAIELIMNEMDTADNPLDKKQQERSYEILMKKMESDDEAFLEMTDSKWLNIKDWMKEAGLIKSDIGLSDIIIQYNNES